MPRRYDYWAVSVRWFRGVINTDALLIAEFLQAEQVPPSKPVMGVAYLRGEHKSTMLGLRRGQAGERLKTRHIPECCLLPKRRIQHLDGNGLAAGRGRHEPGAAGTGENVNNVRRAPGHGSNAASDGTGPKISCHFYHSEDDLKGRLQ
jgi:hypothetical protein